MGMMQRRKGRAFEQWLARRFRDAMPGADIRRGLQARGGVEAADLDMPLIWVEAKHGRKPNIRAALAQADAAAPKGKAPVAIVRDDRCPPTVTLYLDDFLDLIALVWMAGHR